MSDTLHWKSTDTKLVTVGNVHIIERIISPTKVRIDAMAKSLSGPLGQLQPILVTKHLHSAWKVVAGATRLLAAKQLGWSQINATIISADNDIEYQLIEIAENLDRHDLSGAERKRLRTKEKELRSQRLAELESEIAVTKSAPKAKGGRGKKGGVREAARKAGVPSSTAHDAIKPSGKKKPDSLADTKQPSSKTTTSPKSELVKCPLCHGKGMVARVEVETIS